MEKYNTLGHNLKRGIFNFSQKVSTGLHKPTRKFIEEYYRFKKQCFNFEKFLLRSLASIRNLDMLLSIAIGCIGILSEKIEQSIEVTEIIAAAKRLHGLSKSKCKFTFYSIALGLLEIFSKLYTGIAHLLQQKLPSNQRAFTG